MANMFNNLIGKGKNLFGGSGADVPGYSEEGPGSELAPSSGGRRRRRSLRRPKRGSRKVSRKVSRKRSRRHYGGKSQQEQEEQEQQEEQEEQEEQDQEDTSSDTSKDDQGGGRRRRKGNRGKKTRGKTSAWIKHVLQFAKANKMKYGQALKDKRCRSTYKSHKK